MSAEEVLIERDNETAQQLINILQSLSWSIEFHNLDWIEAKKEINDAKVDIVFGLTSQYIYIYWIEVDNGYIKYRADGDLNISVQSDAYNVVFDAKYEGDNVFEYFAFDTFTELKDFLANESQLIRKLCSAVREAVITVIDEIFDP